MFFTLHTEIPHPPKADYGELQSIVKALRLWRIYEPPRRIFKARCPVWPIGSQARGGAPVSQKLIAALLKKVYVIQFSAFAKGILSKQAPNTGWHAREKSAYNRFALRPLFVSLPYVRDFQDRRITMGILSNTVSFCQYQVSGEFPDKDLYEWAADRLAQNAFRAIDQTAEELSFGWVHFDDFSNNSFTTPHAFWRDHYLAFTLRRDQRRVPAVLLKAYQEKAENDYLASNPGLKWVPKDKRHDLRNAVRSALLSKTLPLPAMYDAVWDTRTGVVTFSSLTPKIQELFEHLFERTFQMGLVAIHPFARAERVLDKSLRPALQKANCAPTDAVADLIKGNRWLGLDFLLWLIYQTTNGSSEYTVSQSGLAPQGAPFVAYLNDRFVLLGGGDKGAQKITVAGRQDNFKEALTALQNGKEITEATLYLEKEEHVWRMTLKGETFHFASFKCPAVKLERDELTDESSEREAVFYERMHVLEGGLQLFDSLYNDFLNKRLSQEWEQRTMAIREWLI